MDEGVREAIYRAVQTEPFTQALRMELIALEEGYSVTDENLGFG